MSPVAAPRKRARRKRKRPSLLSWWPLLLALIATPFAVRAASGLVLSGPGARRRRYPFVARGQAHAPAAFAPEQRDTLAEWVMWAQFPVYGLLAVIFGRWRGPAAGLLAALVVHGMAVAAAVLLAR